MPFVTVFSPNTLWRRRLTMLAVLAALVLAGYALHAGSYIQALDNLITERRMAIAPRRATGGFAFIAIDKESLDTVGVWPWPRHIYADMIRELVKSGARDIAFDIDFSVPSSPAEDAAFATALKNAGGGAILPVFLQRGSVEGARPLALSQPIPMLAENGWIGAVNVVPGRDGVLRSMPYGITTPDGQIPSIPALMAGKSDHPPGSFPIDFSVDPATVPSYPVHRLLKGQLASGALAGKSVLVGAQAVELKDYFNVPVHGNIPGPMVQLLAAETLAQGRVAAPVNGWLVIAAAFLSIGLFYLLRPRRLGFQYALLAGLVVAFEGVAFVLFQRSALLVPTAAADLSFVAIAIIRTATELDVRRWLLRLASLETRNTRQLLEQVIADSSDAILIASEAGIIIDRSARVQEVFRAARDFGPGDVLANVLPARLTNEVAAAFGAIRTGKSQPGAVREIELRGEDGVHHIEYSITPSRLEAEGGEAFAVCIAARDITDRRRQAAALDHLSRYDALTGALRETEFVQRLQQMLESDPVPLVVYSLNLHRFKTINAALGRDAGDDLLATVARTLETYDPGVVLVGRTGGDSFCLARIGQSATADAERFAESLIRTLGVPFILGEHRAKIGVHIGFACSNGVGEGERDAAQLLDDAEFALDNARAISGSGWSRFDPAASVRIIQSRQVERELWRSLERNEIFVTYQPQVSLRDRQVIGAEALVRWNSPKLGMVSPGDFVEIAEANGFVEKLGQWVLSRACADAMSWEKPLIVAVNVSPLQFSRGDVVGDVQQALAQSRLPPQRLQLEITESTFLDHSEEMIGKLHALKALGVSLALDDFGTGYSSFGYIARFPLDKIKVDQMFVRSIDTSPSSEAIVRSVHSLCEGLSIRMICEGIENERQLAMLRDIGCEQGQGWLFGKAQSNAELQALIRHAKP